MGIEDPQVDVTCDGCSCVVSMGMTALARHSWDMRHLEGALKGMGWKNIPEGSDFWYCEDCAEEAAAKEKPRA